MLERESNGREKERATEKDRDSIYREERRESLLVWEVREREEEKKI